MKPFSRLKYNIWVQYLLLCGLVFSFQLLQAQKGRVNIYQSMPQSSIEDNALEVIEDDTISVLALFERVNSECKKHKYLNLDTVQFYAHRALSISHRIKYTRGTRKLHEALGWAYYVKVIADSSKYYYNLGIDRAKIECDTVRLWINTFRIGWVYLSESKFDSSILYFKKSMQYAMELKDTSRYQSSSSQLARIYLNKGDYLATVKQGLEVIRLAKLRADTFDLLYMYGMLGALYGDMGLYEKEMKMAHTTLQIAE
jgi:tetratricopeptide (TPR) repeat protein